MVREEEVLLWGFALAAGICVGIGFGLILHAVLS